MLKMCKIIWNYKEADKKLMCDMMHNTNWNALITGDVDLSWQRWKNVFKDIMKTCIPRIKKQYRCRLPWISSCIIHAIRWRNRLYHKFQVSKSASVWERYKYSRNRVVKMIQLSKEKFFNQLSRNVSDPQQFWKIVNLLKVNNSITIPSLMHETIY